MATVKDALSTIDIATITIASDTTLDKVAAAMKEKNAGLLLVSEGDQTVGLISERDLVRKVMAESKPYDTKVSDIMTKEIKAMTEDKKLVEAFQSMQEGGFRHLPIQDADGKYIGLLSETGLIEFILKKIGG